MVAEGRETNQIRPTLNLPRTGPGQAGESTLDLGCLPKRRPGWEAKEAREAGVCGTASEKSRLHGADC